MDPKIKVGVVREKSFDPTFVVRVDYDSEAVSFSGAMVSVVRKPPKVLFEHPPEILERLTKAEQQKIELEIMNRILEFIMGSAEHRLPGNRNPRG